MRDIEEEGATKLRILMDDNIDDAHAILGNEGGLQGAANALGIMAI